MADNGFAFSTGEDPTVPQQEGINLTTTNMSPLPDPVLTDRAKRADFALGDNSPGPSILRDQFRQGGEQAVREQAAASANTEFQGQKLSAIDAAVKSGAPVTDNDINTIMAVGTTPEANPATVFEDKYGKNVVTSGIVGEPGKNLVFQSAIDKIPDEVNRAARIGMAVVSRKQQVLGVLEETQAAHDALPWVAWDQPGQQDKLGNLTKDMLTFGFGQYVAQHNLLNSEPEQSAFLPGDNKLAQIKWLYLQPRPADILRQVAGPDSKLFKEDPNAALDFVKAAHQFSTSDALVDNIFGVANAASLVPLGLVTKGMARLISGGGEKVAVNLTKDEAVANLAKGQQAATDVLNASPASPKTLLTPKGLTSASNALDILSESPKPPTPGHYFPENAVRNASEISIQNGVPKVLNPDGIEVQASRTPIEGHVKIEPAAATSVNNYTTKAGTVDFKPGGEEGTIYVTPKQADRLSSVLDPEKNHVILNDEKGYFVGNKDNISPGKEVRGTRIQPATEPARGLIPVHLGEGNDKPVFGQKITRVESGEKQNYTISQRITSQEDADMKTAMSDIVKAQGNNIPSDVLSKMGQQKTASELSATKQIAEKETQTVPLGNAQEIRSRVPTHAQPVPYYNDSSGLNWKRATDIVNEYQSGFGLNVEPLAPTAHQKMIDLAKAKVSQYNRMSVDAVRDQVTHYDPLTNTYAVETKIGRPNGDLFDSRANANFYRTMQYRMGSAATVEQEGNKFYLSHLQHGDETQSLVRNNIPVGNETPRPGILGTLFSLVTGKIGPNLRSAVYNVSKFQTDQRVVVDHAPKVLMDLISEKAEDIRAMTKNERNELRDILVYNRDFNELGKPRYEAGHYYTSENDFNQAFYTRFNKQPTDTQWKAYERITNISDLDWVLRESRSMRDNVRQGIRQYNFSFTNRTGEKIDTDWIKGKEVPDMYPEVSANANVYVLPTNEYTSKYGLKDGSAGSKDITDKLKSEEYKIVQIANPRSKPLADATGIKEDIHFVITNKFDNKPVEWGENVPHHPGGHSIYVPQHYMKQPQIQVGSNGQLTYYGDVSAKAFNTKKEVEFWSERYNKARELMQAGDAAGFDAHVTKNLPETPDELRAAFHNGTFNLEHPFMYATTGRSTLESNEAFVASNKAYQGLKDTFTAYNLSANEEKSFLADRDAVLNTIANKGTDENPVWHHVAAEQLDPYAALQKGITQIARNRWMADYKREAAESWIAEFGHMFDQSKLPIERLRLNPLYYLYHNDAVDTAVIKANPAAFAAMKTSRDAILRFIGSKDELGSTLDGLSQQLINSIDNKMGNKMAARAELYLPSIKSIPEYARSATFDMADGFFNIVQLPQQALGMTNALAISPKNGVHAMSAWGIANRMKYTEDAAILGKYGDLATKLGWDKDQFMEAYQGWKNSGVHMIGGEYSARSTFNEPELFKSAWGNFRDKGRVFFNSGEEINRDVSYFTAYRDWRDKNPTAAFDNRAQTQILGRFNTLNQNMSRASNAAYNEGVLSIPTQFWTWNARHAEQMLTFGANRQLDIDEKLRLLGANSLMWGIPSAVGGATFGLPLGLGLIPSPNFDDIRQFAIKNGINLHSDFVEAISKGLPEMAMNYIAGSLGLGDKEKGISHGIDLHRFSPNADQTKIFQDVQSGKKDWHDLVLGASGSLAWKMVAATQPFFAALTSVFSKDGQFPIITNDLIDMAKLVSSVNNGIKAYYAWNWGMYYSKNMQPQAENVDKFESVMLGLGLGLNRVSDAWQMTNVIHTRDEAIKSAQKRMTEDASIMFRAAQQGDNATVDTQMKRISTMAAGAGMTNREERKFLRQVLSGQESFVEHMNRQWLQKGPDMTDIPTVKKFFNNLDRK